MLEAIKKVLRRTPLVFVARAARSRAAIRRWEALGRPLPPPPAFKQSVVRMYGKRFGLHTLVETGTYQAEMVTAQQKNFQRIVSIELDQDLVHRADALFAGMSHISILQGDSSQILPGVVAEITAPCVFWLDAHYSGGITARGILDTPIVQELEILFSRRNNRDVILIDDVHAFDGSNDYPALADLLKFLAAARPNSVLEVADNIIRLHPKDPKVSKERS